MTRIAIAAAFLVLIQATVAQAQGPKVEVPDSLLKQAKVTEAAARKAALAKAPRGTVKEVELEREKGRLIFSYDISVPGVKGVTEVNVDAVTGAVVGVEHEDEAAEAREKKGPYHLVSSYTLGGDGGWDYVTVDTLGNRLFLARQNRVMVVDENTGKLLGEIPGLSGAHGVALAYDAGHGFATSGRDSSVTMFDLKTLNVLGKTTAAEDADAVFYDPVSKRVFTMNGDANSSSVIDPVSGKNVGTIPLDGKPEFGVSAGDGKLYANLEDSSQVVEIDSKTLMAVRRWSLGDCQEPTGLAIDRVHHRLFSGCRNKLMAISDAAAGRLITTVPAGEGIDGNGFDPGTQMAFSANGGDGTITVVHEDSPEKFSVVQNVSTMTGARTMGVDPRNHKVFTVSAKFGPRPDSSASNPRRRPPVLPGTFAVLVLSN
jgi:DNA-binding beta-propeller fold protein YncE